MTKARWGVRFAVFAALIAGMPASLHSAAPATGMCRSSGKCCPWPGAMCVLDNGTVLNGYLWSDNVMLPCPPLDDQ
jgi:hypothetical protein